MMRQMALGSLVMLAATILLADTAAAQVRVSRGRTTVHRSGSVRESHRRSDRDVVIRRPGPSRVTVIRRPTVVRPVPWGTTVVTLPRYRTVVVGPTTYYVDGGVYYVRERPDRYVVVRPPIGVAVEAIPSDYQEVVIGDDTYYYYEDVYYDTSMHVVDVPFGGFITYLPPRYEVVPVRGVQYYRVGPAYYRPIVREGRTAYLRVKIDLD